MISPPKRSARARESALLPDAVGPIRRIAGIIGCRNAAPHPTLSPARGGEGARAKRSAGEGARIRQRGICSTAAHEQTVQVRQRELIPRWPAVVALARALGR